MEEIRVRSDLVNFYFMEESFLSVSEIHSFYLWTDSWEIGWDKVRPSMIISRSLEQKTAHAKKRLQKFFPQKKFQKKLF